MKTRPIQSLRLLAPVLVICLACTTAAQSQSRSQSDTDIILAAERAWAQAAVDHDVATFQKYMSDDYVLIEMSTGTDKQSRWDVTTKSAWVEKVRSGREKFDSVEIHNLKVILNENVATVTGEYSQKGTTDGKDNSAAGLYVDTWVKRKGQWLLVNSVFPRVSCRDLAGCGKTLVRAHGRMPLLTGCRQRSPANDVKRYRRCKRRACHLRLQSCPPDVGPNQASCRDASYPASSGPRNDPSLL